MSFVARCKCFKSCQKLRQAAEPLYPPLLSDPVCPLQVLRDGGKTGWWIFLNPLPQKNRGHQLAASSVYDNLFSSNFKLSARGFHICWVSVSVLLCGFNITAETASLWSTFRHTMWSWETASFWPLSQHSSSLPVVYSTVDIHCGVKRLPALLPLSLDELPASGLKIQSMSPRKASEGLPFTFRNFIFLPSIFSILFLSLLFQSSFSCAQILYMHSYLNR